MSGFLKLYWCLCTESADHESWIPDECSGHGSRLAASHPNINPGSMAARHECPDLRRCAA